MPIPTKSKPKIYITLCSCCDASNKAVGPLLHPLLGSIIFIPVVFSVSLFLLDQTLVLSWYLTSFISLDSNLATAIEQAHYKTLRNNFHREDNQTLCSQFQTLFKSGAV